ncbi:MAG: MBL fold metallo-hydrolase [Deltaproteobacteria bacterium]|nr:MBL fold metallo-hydrolase [Deltaproteobacteria bacterium]
MAYEIDYTPVGDGERGGDAIAMRYGVLDGPQKRQTVIVIDGGTKESGQALVNHIKTFYGTDVVDVAISTHPDQDHASGLCEVLENLTVHSLLMHRPWEHAQEIKNMFKDGRITASGLEERIEKSLQNASDLEAIAKRKNIPIYEPFQGMTAGTIFHVLGPSKEYYESLLPHLKDMPTPKISLGVFAPILKTAEGVVNWIEDNMGIDLLNDDEDTTSPSNNTSTIILFNLDGHKLLFTGDAGKTALLNAIAYAESLPVSISLSDLSFLGVPHHGSKRNINSKIMKKIIARTAFVSAPKDGNPKHPSKKVTNALQKHGSTVYVTRGNNLLHQFQGNVRGWGNATREPFHARVED